MPSQNRHGKFPGEMAFLCTTISKPWGPAIYPRAFNFLIYGKSLFPSPSFPILCNNLTQTKRKSLSIGYKSGRVIIGMDTLQKWPRNLLREVLILVLDFFISRRYSEYIFVVLLDQKLKTVFITSDNQVLSGTSSIWKLDFSLPDWHSHLPV